jgi:hypothetical protein
MFAHKLIRLGYRVLYIPANSIRSFGSSLEEIVTKHLSFALSMEKPPSIEVELSDPDLTGKPVLIIIDGLDEYDVGDTTVSLAAARLVEHSQKAIDDWQIHGRDVRLLLCGRPEAASSLTAQFRKKFHHLQVTGFVHELSELEQPANSSSDEFLKVDQRDIWWRKWQARTEQKITGLPQTIASSKDQGVLEITSQPLLNYMIAVLCLHEGEKLSRPC